MKKLYANEDPIQVRSSIVAIESTSVDYDQDLKKLDCYFTAYESTQRISEYVANENYEAVNEKSYFFFNECMKTIQSNLLGEVKMPIVSMESIQTTELLVLNRSIALEGFVKDLWEKMKAIFNKIYEAIKGFLKQHFTRIGRLKSRLEEIDKTLAQTDKDIKQYSTDKVPGSLRKYYPYDGTLTSGIITTVHSNVSKVISSFSEVNNLAEDFSKKDIIDANLIKEIEELKKKISENSNQISENDKNKKKGLLGEAKFGKDGRTNKDLNESNKSLSDEIKENQNKITEKEERITSVTEKNDSGNDTEKDIQIKKELTEFIDALVKSLDGIKGLQLPLGKSVTGIKADLDTGLDIQTEISDTEVTEVNLSDKAKLVKMVASGIELLNESEKMLTVYGKINDAITDSIKTIDKNMIAIDNLENKTETASKYKKVLNDKIKARLKALKVFFSEYNKVCKTIYGHAADSADGISEYAITSLKYFS